MKILLALVTSFLLILASVISWADEFPDWVPEDAFEAAKKLWPQCLESFYKENSITDEFGLKDREEALQCTLKYPHKVIWVDYEDYEIGTNILELYSPDDESYGEAYRFGIYLNDNHVGYIDVRYEHGSWGLAGICGRHVDHKDKLGPIYTKYPVSEGYKIYSKPESQFFIVKNDTLIEVFEWSVKKFGYVGIDPIEYMLKVKQRLEEFKKLPEYEIVKKIKEDRRNKLKKKRIRLYLKR